MARIASATVADGSFTFYGRIQSQLGWSYVLKLIIVIYVLFTLKISAYAQVLLHYKGKWWKPHATTPTTIFLKRASEPRHPANRAQADETGNVRGR